MANIFKKGLSVLLAALMFIGVINVTALAQEDDGWLGGDVKLNVTEGTDGYTYMLFGDIPNFYYYETSNHTLLKEVTKGGAVHLIALVDTKANIGEWTPNGVYSFGESNYDVVYCCDAATGSEAGDYYKRLNLEDSEYFSDEQAAELRAILTHAYPYLSVEEAKAWLKEAGFEYADELDRSELISATQAAVWSIANYGNGDSYKYNKTATTAQKNTWGGYLHNFSAEISNFKDSTTSRKYITDTNIGARINALKDFYLALPGVEAEEGQIVISSLSFANAAKAGSGDLYTVDLNVALNHGADENDNIVLNTYIDGELFGEPMNIGETENYTLTIAAKANSDVKVVVSGTQNLEKGVYFYAPKPVDVDGDGIATSREVSQNLIGVASGETPIFAEANIEFENVTFKKGTVSNVSYMFINKETGEVEFMRKIDVPENATSVPIITMEGYVSAMFMKQATSGMFWFSEEVDEEAEQAVIDCLIDNNPSYKGHNAVCYGKGAHDLEFKKNKVVTYVFGETEVELGVTVNKPEETVEEPSEEPVVEETEKNNKNNKGNSKNKKNK